jgi:hypothetical protein
LRLQSHSFDMTKLASTRMDLLAAGMGVDPPAMEGEETEGMGISINSSRVDGNGIGGTRKTVLTPGSAEEWIARQGYEGMLHC